MHRDHQTIEFMILFTWSVQELYREIQNIIADVSTFAAFLNIWHRTHSSWHWTYSWNVRRWLLLLLSLLLQFYTYASAKCQSNKNTCMNFNTNPRAFDSIFFFIRIETRKQNEKWHWYCTLDKKFIYLSINGPIFFSVLEPIVEI